MPRGDKTGPEGKGERTGRGMGKCDPKANEKELEKGVSWRLFGKKKRTRTPDNPKGDGTNSENGSGRPAGGRGRNRK